MPTLGAVRRITAAEAPAGDNTFETATLGGANGIHELADLEEICSHGVPGLHFLGEVAEFADALDTGEDRLLAALSRSVHLDTLLCEVPDERLGQTAEFLVAVAELDGRIAVLRGLGLDLKNPVGSDMNDRDRHEYTVGVIHTGMTHLESDKSERHGWKS